MLSLLAGCVCDADDISQHLQKSVVPQALAGSDFEDRYGVLVKGSVKTKVEGLAFSRYVQGVQTYSSSPDQPLLGVPIREGTLFHQFLARYRLQQAIGKRLRQCWQLKMWSPMPSRRNWRMRSVKAVALSSNRSRTQLLLSAGVERTGVERVKLEEELQRMERLLWERDQERLTESRVDLVPVLWSVWDPAVQFELESSQLHLDLEMRGLHAAKETSTSQAHELSGSISELLHKKLHKD
eukprot:g6936.t1